MTVARPPKTSLRRGLKESLSQVVVRPPGEFSPRSAGVWCDSLLMNVTLRKCNHVRVRCIPMDAGKLASLGGSRCVQVEGSE